MSKKIVGSLVLLLASLGAHAETIEIKVHGMVCGFCAQGVEKILRENPATVDVLVSIEEKLVVVSTQTGKDISDAELTNAILDSGYEVKGITRSQRTMDEVRGQIRQAAR